MLDHLYLLSVPLFLDDQNILEFESAVEISRRPYPGKFEGCDRVEGGVKDYSYQKYFTWHVSSDLETI